MRAIPIFILAAISLVLLSSAAEGKNVVCYFASWTVYRYSNGKFDVENIDPSLCTHIMFGFVGLSPFYKVMLIDSWEATDDYGYKGIENLVGLKQTNPNLKVLVSMGGWEEGSTKYSQLAADPIKRQVLAKDVLRFVQEYGFDGFDLDWEYPGLRENADPEHDLANYIELLKDLRGVLAPHGYILSAAVSGGVKNMDIAYDVAAVSELLDLINVMAYDFHGAFEPYVGHVAPLYASHLDTTDEQKTLNVASGIQHWLDRGADPAKINLGVVMYGRSFTLANASNTELYAPIKGGGTAGPYTADDGIVGYNEICEFYKDWSYIWDNEQRVPHLVSGDQWVGYDDINSIKLKVEYANSKNLAGIMVWSLDTDDFLGTCNGGKYPLLRTINETLE